MILKRLLPLLLLLCRQPAFAQVKQSLHSSSCFLTDLKTCSSQLVMIDYPVFEHKGKPLTVVNDSVLSLVRKYVGVSLFTSVALDTGFRSVLVKNDGVRCEDYLRDEFHFQYEDRVNDGQVLSFVLYYSFHRKTRELKDSLFSAECPLSYDVQKGSWIDMKTLFKPGSEGDLYSIADRNADMSGNGHLTHVQLQQAGICVFERDILFCLPDGRMFLIPCEELKEVMVPYYYKQMPHKAPQ